MTKDRIEELQTLCLRFRNDLIDLLYSIQTGHPGGSLSCTEILTTLFFDKMNIDPKNPDMEGRDNSYYQRPCMPHALYCYGGERIF